MYSNGRFFPPEYYEGASTNTTPKNSRWFCNKPLSPISTNSGNAFEHSSIKHSDTSQTFEEHPNSTSSTNMNRLLLNSLNSTTQENGIDLLEGNALTSSDESQSIDDSSDSEYKPNSKFDSTVSSSDSETSHIDDVLMNNTKMHDIASNTKPNQNNFKVASTVHKKKNQNFCFFCESLVYNFARHITRNHSNERETLHILSEPAGSRKRKELLNDLRKKGNYLQDCEKGKPIRKNENTMYMPCPDCLGFYGRKNLWRHRKKCPKNISKLSRSMGDSQNLLVRNVRVDPKLRELVFPRMRADEVSLAAKKDILICAFAARYIKVHREKHFINVASRRMRDLAKILIEIRKLQPIIRNLFDALKPEYFDLLVTATKTVARYDQTKEYYEAPTFALNMGTSLKQCCDIALLQVLKRKEVYQTIPAATAEADIKTLMQLIEAHWRFDISSQAAHDLNIKKWNKITLVPLASDLKLLKSYLIRIANESVAALQKYSKDQKAYTKLLETIFCRVILLNRKRPGELQRLLLHTYESTIYSNKNLTYEEFSEVVTETEKILMTSLKRVVIRGKRGRGVPVLFSEDVQEHLTLILKYREGIIKKENLYLFGNPNTSEPITGYKVLNKYAIQCGAKNPSAITCTRLRKHLATLTQLFNMTENDLEQLAAFMGHTLGVHKSSYRLPDDVYQTAKISKLLLLMERGEAGQFRGKKLDEIDLDLEEDLMSSQDNKAGTQMGQDENVENLNEDQVNDDKCNANKDKNEPVVQKSPAKKVYKKGTYPMDRRTKKSGY